MADIAASVLALEEAISFACSSFARKNFCVVWKNPSMPKTSF